MVAKPAVEQAQQILCGDVPLAAKADNWIERSSSAHFPELAYRGACQLVGFGQAELRTFREFIILVFERYGDDRCFRCGACAHDDSSPPTKLFFKKSPAN